MAQRFLLSSKARTLDLCEVLGLSEEGARTRFTALIWPETDGRPGRRFTRTARDLAKEQADLARRLLQIEDLTAYDEID